MHDQIELRVYRHHWSTHSRLLTVYCVATRHLRLSGTDARAITMWTRNPCRDICVASCECNWAHVPRDRTRKEFTHCPRSVLTTNYVTAPLTRIVTEIVDQCPSSLVVLWDVGTPDGPFSRLAIPFIVQYGSSEALYLSITVT